jgi:hypothetical protein
VVLRLETLDQHVIHIHFHVPSDLGFEHHVHKPLISCFRIL